MMDESIITNSEHFNVEIDELMGEQNKYLNFRENVPDHSLNY